MPKLSELKSVEIPVTQWLSKMGWEHKSNQELAGYSRPLSNPVIEQVLIEKVASINKIDEDKAQIVVDQLLSNLNNPSPILGNENFLDKLVKGVTISFENDDQDFYFIDFDEIFNNDFIVTNQYWVQENKLVKTDIVLLINGIPLIPIEAKQRSKRGTNWLEGVRQFSTYEVKTPRYFITHAFGVAVNGRITKYGIPGATSSYFNEWKDTIIDTTYPNPILNPANDLCATYINENDGYTHFDVQRYPNGEVQEKMKLGIIGLLQPARVLDILKNYIVFERTEGKVVKKVARYQQLRASNKIVDRVINTNLNQGVIWHTQGSGKSLTMLFTAYKMRTAEELNDPTVYIVVDRKDLREQIGGTFDDCEFPNARPVYNINDLKYIIETAPAGVFITTIQKFRELGNRKDDRGNIIILIDEAHRSEYGDFQIELKNVLPNAKRFAFTGTPIPKTHREFGIKKDKEQHEHFLDRYSIQDAIDDNATVPIKYTFGPQKWFLDKDNLKKGYEEITEELNEEEKRAVERRVQSWKVFLKHPDRIEILSKDIADDFRNMVEPQGYKAQIVACDKEAAVLYYNELMNYFDPSEVAIIFSTGHYDEEDKYTLYEPHYKDDVERKRLIQQFKRPITQEELEKGNNLKILIVVNMLLTGFDAPVEQTMYLDSPLRDHNLLQAVARTNRPYDDKTSGLTKKFGRIVDYIGVFENYKEALNYDPNDIGEFEDVESLIKQFPAELDKVYKLFEGITLEDTYECVMAITTRLSEIDQADFEQKYRELVQLWESLSPHAKLKEYRDQYRWLIEIYELYLEEFKRLDFDPDIYAAKTRKLIQESTRLLNFRGHLPEIAIDKNYIQQLNDSKLSPADKAEKLIRDIETVIRKNELNSPVYADFQKRLEALIKQKEEETESLERIIISLSELFSELDEVANLPQKMGFNDKGTFDIFILVKNSLPDNFNENIAKEFAIELYDKVIKNKIYIGWQEIEREVRMMQLNISVFASSDKYDPLKIDTNNELLEEIVKCVINNYSLV